MSVYIAFAICAVVGYLIGSISFARIFSWAFGKKDITKVGSHNPGTMNMLRTRGFGEAILTLVMDAIKSGLPALIVYFVINHFYAGEGNLAYFITAFFAIVGHCFPVYYKFKGGKGVASTFGLFTFHPTFWWISLIVFVICFLLLLFVLKYGSVVSFTYILTMSITSTCLLVLNSMPNWIPCVVIIWLNVILVFALHHGNIKRLLTGKENKVDLMSKIKGKKGDDNEENSETSDATNDVKEEEVEVKNETNEGVEVRKTKEENIEKDDDRKSN